MDMQKHSPEGLYKKAPIKNFKKLTGENQCRGLFLKKVAGLRSAKKETLAQVFSGEFCEIFKITFFEEHLRAAASAYEKLTN